MLNRLVDLSVAQRWLALLFYVALAAAGAWAIVGLPIDAFPDVSPVQVKVIYRAPGLTPQEVESQVTTPLEVALEAIPKETTMRSVSKYAVVTVTLDFEEGSGLYWARDQVFQRLQQAKDELPPDATGGLAPIATPLSAVLMFTLEGGDLNLRERRTLVDWTLRPALRSVKGVADLNALGGLVEAYEVEPDPAALAHAGLTVDDLKAQLMTANRDDGAGRLDETDQALIVRSVGAIKTVDDLRDTMIAQKGGGQVRLGDLATVKISSMTRYGAVTKDGQGEVSEAIVESLKGANADQVIADSRAKLASIELPKGVKPYIFYDRSKLIHRAVHTVVEALLEAMLFVVALLFLFLLDVRASSVVALSLPMAALITVLLMRVTGISANLMSLGGLAIAIGMLVDGAIVIVENATERLAEDHGRRPRREVVAEAAKEVIKPVTAGVFIICLVFTPLLSLQGQEGKMFRPVAVIIVFALAASLLLSLTFTPALASLVLKTTELKPGQTPKPHKPSWLMRKILPPYERLLKGALGRPRLIIGIAVAGALVSVAGYFLVGKSFIPTLEEGTIVMQLTKQPSINLARSLAIDGMVQKAILKEVPEVKDVVSRTGADQLRLDPMGLNETDTFITLRPKKTWRHKNVSFIVGQIRQIMTRFPGLESSFTQPIEMRTDEMLTGARGAVVIKIFGKDLDKLSKLAVQIRDVTGKVKGASDPMTQASDRLSYLELKADRMRAGGYGVSVQSMQDDMRAMLEGVQAGLVRDVDKRTPILIRAPDTMRQHPETFAQTEIATPGGGEAHLEDMAQVTRNEGPVSIDREHQERDAEVQVNVEHRALVAFVKDAQKAVAQQVKLPSGYHLQWAGQFQEQKRAAARILLVIPIALVLICVVLYLALDSVRQMILIMVNVPFALVGGMLTLWVSGQYLSVPASVGFIALLGIAVLNGLVLVDHYSAMLKDGVALKEVVVEGAKRRLRPVLMTASITALGLVPLLFASGPGSSVQRPLAVVVVGGLVTSTLLTLIMLPMLFLRYGVAPRDKHDAGPGMAA